jgi:tetratricopeptide (TPR) repeat protein
MRNTTTQSVTGGCLSPTLARAIWVSLVVVLLAACAHRGYNTPGIAELPDLQLPAGRISPAEALSDIHSPDMLALNDDMREFVDRYIRTGSQRQRLLTLHQSVRSPAFLGIRYDAGADGTAMDVFERGAANCLSYAHLFVALARYANLDANYQSLSLRPEWSRHGDQVALRQHVNVRVDMRNGLQYMVDIDPVSRDLVANAELISDSEALALYHANIAMDALLRRDTATAFGQALRALDLAPGIDYLWVNLGAIYRQVDQNGAAEHMYLTALDLNPRSRSAMNNLAVLYRTWGDMEESLVWENKVRHHRESNPYYHYYLGAEAEREGDLDTALEQYLAAIELKASDAEFYYRVARVYHARADREATLRFLNQAIERSRLVGEQDEYRNFLREVTGDNLARAVLPEG